MKKYGIGDRVSLDKRALSISYIQARQFYTNMYEGKSGTILGYSETGKAAVEFDDIVFTRPENKISSHDHGCHGKGKRKYSWYIPDEYLNPIAENNNLLLLL
jgi:hypothetical protein